MTQSQPTKWTVFRILSRVLGGQDEHALENCITAGLLPIMLGSGTGSEVMRRIAAPMVGGMISATVLTLALIPAVFLLVQRHRYLRK